MTISNNLLNDHFVLSVLGVGDRDYSQQSEEFRASRSHFIDRAYREGGRGFVDRCVAYGRTEKGEPIVFSKVFLDLLAIIGDLRISHAYTTGPAQIGKTLGNYLLFVDCLVEGSLNTAWIYDTNFNIQNNVPSQFRPLLQGWVEGMREAGRPIAPADRNVLTRCAINGGLAIFAFASSSRYRSGSSMAAAGGGVVAFQADILFLEERSQYPPGVADPLPRRLDASRLPNKPIRELGTPGGGAGIEVNFRHTKFCFYPHVTCPHCQQTIALDPKGCLLRESIVRDVLGREKNSFLGESGRPKVWFHSDPHDPARSASVCCSNCHLPLTRNDRLSARLHCRNTGLPVDDFLARIPANGRIDEGVVVHLSPLIRDSETIASEIINAGLTAESSIDWQQQMLGHVSETSQESLSYEILREAIVCAAPQAIPNLTIAGIDIGRSDDWVMIAEIFFPEDWRKLKPIDLFEQSTRSIVFGGGVSRTQIPDLLTRYEVSYGLIDNEPSREASMRICRESVLEMGDNGHPNQPEVIKRVQVVDGGLSGDCWRIRTPKFFESILEGFLRSMPDGGPRYRLPRSWERYLTLTGNNPLAHLCGPTKTASGQWQRAKNHVDDLFFALAFLEAAFYIKIQNLKFPSANTNANNDRSRNDKPFSRSDKSPY